MASGIVEVLDDVSRVLGGGRHSIEGVDLAIQAITVSRSDVLAPQLACHQLGAAVQHAEMPEELSSVDLLGVPLALLRIGRE
jgi:hypothetical protein